MKRMENGILIDMTPAEIAEFDASRTPTPEQSRTAALRKIEADRDAALAAGFDHAGKRWHCDAIVQAQITGLLAAYREGLLPDAATVQVRDMSNTTNALTRAQLTTLAGAMMPHVQTIWAQSWAAKDALP